MPSKSEKQRRFMQAAAHSKEFAEKAGIDQKVAKEFVEKDKEKEQSKEAHEGHIQRVKTKLSQWENTNED